MSDQPPTRKRLRDKGKSSSSTVDSEEEENTNTDAGTETDPTTTDEKQPRGDEITCPECDSPITTNHTRGDRTCEECGLVIEEEPIDHGPEWRAYNSTERQNKSRVGPARTELRHDRGMSTTIDWKDQDAYGNQLSASKRAQMHRLRTWDKRSKQDSGDRGIAFANGEIMRMGSALGVPKSIRETAGALYRECQEDGLIPGRSIEAMASAVLYIALRVHDEPRSLDEIAQVSRVQRRPISRAHRYIVRELDIPLKPTNPKKYIPRFADAIGVPQEILRTAEHFIEEIPGHHMSGCDPTVLAGAALYSAAIVHGELVTQHSVRDAADITEVSIRNNYKQFLIHVDSIDLSEEDVEEIDSPMGICRALNDEVTYNNDTRRNVASDTDDEDSSEAATRGDNHESDTVSDGQSNGTPEVSDHTTQTPQEQDGSTEQFACEYCSETFTSHNGLRIHQGRIHNGAKNTEPTTEQTAVPFPDADYNFKCLDCNAVFDTHHGLKIHTGHQHPRTNYYSREVYAVLPSKYPATAAEPGTDSTTGQSSPPVAFREYAVETLDDAEVIVGSAVVQLAKTLLLRGGQDTGADGSRTKAVAVAGAVYAAQKLLAGTVENRLTQKEIGSLFGVSNRAVSAAYPAYVTVFESDEYGIPRSVAENSNTD